MQAIAAGLPKLGALNLTANRLQPAPGLSSSLRLTTLVLNQSGVAWADMAALGPCLPALKQLYLNGNSIASLQPPAGVASLQARLWGHPACASPLQLPLPLHSAPIHQHLRRASAPRRTPSLR